MQGQRHQPHRVVDEPGILGGRRRVDQIEGSPERGEHPLERAHRVLESALIDQVGRNPRRRSSWRLRPGQPIARSSPGPKHVVAAYSMVQHAASGVARRFRRRMQDERPHRDHPAGADRAADRRHLASRGAQSRASLEPTVPVRTRQHAERTVRVGLIQADAKRHHLRKGRGGCDRIEHAAFSHHGPQPGASASARIGSAVSWCQATSEFAGGRLVEHRGAEGLRRAVDRDFSSSRVADRRPACQSPAAPGRVARRPGCGWRDRRRARR